MANRLASALDTALHRDLVPEPLIRLGVRRLLRQRLRAEADFGPERSRRFVEARRLGPIAVHASDANVQHYEVPTAFYRLVLGPRLKYSSGYWPEGVSTLDESEEAMLELTTSRAELADGQHVLELGCGWGSLSLWVAGLHSRSRVTAVTNSRTQREFVEAEARRRGLRNLEVIRANVSEFDTGERFDRVVSVEMFEHMRNWDLLLRRIAGWLRGDGKAFVHFFAHARFAYEYEDHGPTDWMARHFFTGGIMPTEEMLSHFARALPVERHWQVSGLHYARTCEAWLRNLKRNRDAILPVLEEAYGAEQARSWWQRWRLFFVACAELFRYRGGREWVVSHNRLRRP